MADAETNRVSHPTGGDSHLTHFSSSAGHEAKYVKPSDLLRPRAHSRPVGPPGTHAPQRAERPIDRDERRALVRFQSFLLLFQPPASLDYTTTHAV
jgi:hypothetical protein